MEKIVLDDIFDFFANLDGKKPNFIRSKSFLEGAIANEKNEKTKQEMRKTLEDLEMTEGLATVAMHLFKKQDDLEKQIKELKHETEKNHNSNLEKIIKLDKGIDNLHKKIDK